MRPHFFLSLLLVCLYSCNSNKTSELPSANAEVCIIDSFIIEGIRSKYELKDLYKVNDSTIVTYSHETNDVSTYLKKPGTDRYLFQSGIPAPVEALPYVFMPNKNGGYLFVDQNRTFYDLDPDMHLLHKRTFHQQMPYLNNDYCFIRTMAHPFIQLGDTLITRYMGILASERLKDLQEQALLEAVFKGDSVTNVRFYFEHPPAFKNYAPQIPLWSFHDNKIDLVWTCLDTIYTYDRMQQTYSKRAIHNPRFKAPENYDHSMRSKAEYNRYDLKFELRNFQYINFWFNEKTQHYVLTYTPPLQDTFQLRRPVPSDKQTRTLVLDKDFNILQDYTYPRRFWNPYLSCLIPGQGQALTLFEDPDDLTVSRVYVFNF